MDLIVDSKSKLREGPSRAVGRFAPSPTGPLHFGSLVAAVGSWLFARHAGGSWIVRMEDLDRPRCIEGADSAILRALESYGLTWDGPVMYQSTRDDAYRDALDSLRRKGLAYDCSCSRSDIARSASAPAPGEDRSELVYPGTCRSGASPARSASSIRFRVAPDEVSFDDLIFGVQQENVARSTGDFVIRRADGVFAYQLAVVVDDAAQGVTQVVRGSDLIGSTARQILLQRALDLATPEYAHLPLVTNARGRKLGKRDSALPLATLDPDTIASTLIDALAILGITQIEKGSPHEMLRATLAIFDARKVPKGTVVR